jgi:hypothetical protein
MEQNEHFSMLKTLMTRQYSVQKLNQFSPGNNVLDIPPSNIDSFLWRDTCVSSIQMKRPILNKVRFFPFENPDWQAVFISKSYSIPTGK